MYWAKAPIEGLSSLYSTYYMAVVYVHNCALHRFDTNTGCCTGGMHPAKSYRRIVLRIAARLALICAIAMLIAQATVGLPGTGHGNTGQQDRRGDVT